MCPVPLKVKLHRLTNSELERYLGKVTNPNPKGDNTEQSPHSSEIVTPYWRTGRPLRKAAVNASYIENNVSDNELSGTDSITKEDNKSPHPKPGKPGSSGLSAARIAAHNKRTVPPEFVLNAVKEYKRSDSPDYSDNLTDSDNASVKTMP